MEFPRRAVNAERALALLALAAALGAAWAEAGAPLARARREGRPWLAWVSMLPVDDGGAPNILLARYDPNARRLLLLHVPGTTRVDRRRDLDGVYRDALKADGDSAGAARAAEDMAERELRTLSPEAIPAVTGRIEVKTGPLGPGDEPAAEAALALKAATRSPRAWARRLREAWAGLLRGGRPALDPLLLAFELRRVPAGNLEAARLPDDAQAPALLARLFSDARPADDGRATTAEVLNGTARTGLASRASKMLRLRGVDVLGTGRAAERARTAVYDRVGDFRRAALVRAALGCPTARAVTRPDATRAVDVSVELGEDCAAGPP
ncbi:MAG: LytR C-terminal domain-containing protein [Elusimicrobia bacterium]|nr:LytR C-terminal domain-containing protein [Elusimicrobiota bacterium]